MMVFDGAASKTKSTKRKGSISLSEGMQGSTDVWRLLSIPNSKGSSIAAGDSSRSKAFGLPLNITRKNSGVIRVGSFWQPFLHSETKATCSPKRNKRKSRSGDPSKKNGGYWQTLFTLNNTRNDRAVGEGAKLITNNFPSFSDTTGEADVASITTSNDEEGEPHAPIPERLVDYFIVVGANLQEQLLQSKQPDKEAEISKSSLLPTFEPQVLDRVPKQNKSWEDMEFPHQVPIFCFPNGYKARKESQEPSIFTFVLTAETGHRLYGSVATIYEPIYLDEIRAIFHDNMRPLPSWLTSLVEKNTELEKKQPQNIFKTDRKSKPTFYLPKALVVISHHPYYSVQTKFLHQLIQLQKSKKSPLPLERYIANFMSDIPLPIKIREGGPRQVVYWNSLLKSGNLEPDSNRNGRVTISRPAPNELPLVNFSYRPLFRCLSVSNILVLWSVLLQEGKVVLVSQHLALLTPVVEALLSLLYPLTWQGICIPLLPSHMLEVLVDAPLPFLVGVTSLTTGYQPEGVVVCDLDQDIVKMGFDENSGEPRLPPILPPMLIARLKVELEEVADPLYLIPPCGIKGRITNGVDDQQIVENAVREPYCQMSRLREASLDNDHRQFIFAQGEYLSLTDMEPQKPMIGGEEVCRKPSEIPSPGTKSATRQNKHLGETDTSVLNAMKRQSRAVQSHADQVLSMTGLVEGYATPSPYAKVYRDDEMEEKKFDMARTLYEIDDSLAHAVRNNFLRFFSTLFMRYKLFDKSRGEGTNSCGDGGRFQHDAFVKSMNVASNSRLWVENIVKSQMFERFLNEPSSRRKLFDEHVILQQNESSLFKKKLPTPFLDKEWPIEQVIIPAGPCGAGILKGRKFRYDRFPKLDEEELVSTKTLDPVDGFFRLFGCSSLWCFTW